METQAQQEAPEEIVPDAETRPAGDGIWVRCTVLEAGAAEDQNAYIFLTGPTNSGGAFYLWFTAAPAAKREILATALTAISSGYWVDAVIVGFTNYATVNRLYLVAPGA